MEYAEIVEETHKRPARQLIKLSIYTFFISGALATYALMDAYPNILVLPRSWFALFLNRTVNIEPIQKLWADISEDLLKDKSPRNRERINYILTTLRAFIHEHFDITRAKLRDIVHSIQIILLLHKRIWLKYTRPAITTVYKRIIEIIRDSWKMIKTHCIPQLKFYFVSIWDFFRKTIHYLNLKPMISVIPISVYNSYVRVMNLAWELCNDIARDIHEVVKTIGEFVSALINRVHFLIKNMDQFVKYMMGEADTFDYSPVPYVKAVLRSIRRKIQRFMKFLRHRINMLRKRINAKLRCIMAWGEKQIRNKYKMLQRAWNNLRDGINRWREAKWSWFRRISNYIGRILRRIHDYFESIISRIVDWLTEMYEYIIYRLSKWLPYWRQNIVNRFKYSIRKLWKAIRSYVDRLFDLVRYYKQVVRDYVDLFKTPNVLQSIVKPLRRAIDQLTRTLKTIFEGILNLVKTLNRFIQNTFKQIIDTIISIIKTITSIKETIHSVTKAIIRAVYSVVRYIIIFLRIKKLDKWRYIASGVYYVLYASHKFLYWVKYYTDYIQQIPFDAWQWMVERITLFKEWLNEQIFVKPGLFYFIGDVIRSITDNKAITGWLANQIGGVKLLQFIVHDGKLFKDMLSDWLSDTFVKQWIRTHVFRPTTTSTTTTGVPDLRPYFQREKILESIRMGGCCNLPQHPLDSKMAGRIGTYLYELFNGELV